MATDALIQLQASVTKTATFNGTALTLPGGTPRRGLNCRVLYSSASNASGSNTVVWSVDVSYDAGTTWFSDFSSPAITLSSTNQAGELFIPFSVSPTSVSSGIKIRLTATIAGSGTSPTVTYGGEISTARP